LKCPFLVEKKKEGRLQRHARQLKGGIEQRKKKSTKTAQIFSTQGVKPPARRRERGGEKGEGEKQKAAV